MTAVSRVVLDTNVLISALLFRQCRLAPLRAAWQGGRLVPIICKQTGQELLRVLGYAKFKLDPSQIEEILSLYLPYAQSHTIISPARQSISLPQCRDIHDQIFVDLASSAQADLLVSGDSDLLSMNDVPNEPLSFKIITPQALLERLSLV